MNASPLGIALLLFAVATAVSYSVFLKKLSLRYSAFTIIAVQNLIGAIYFFPFFLFLEWNIFISVKPDFTMVSSLLALAVFCSSLAYVFFTIATREMGCKQDQCFL
ncbi:MAG: DMT family transporter [Marinilabiliales bacterium]|nr:DMT family transporter [Marinilabiliales bacterium]